MPARRPFALLAAACLAPATLAASRVAGRAADHETDRCRAVASIPAAVRPFVERGTCAIALARADLDRDGHADYLLVLERLGDAADADGAGRPRVLLVLAADGDTLRPAARSDRAVLASRAGGVLGDPFDELDAGPGRFTVHHFGGASWRWRTDFTFGWSRRDRAWQLVRASEVSFHAGDPEKTMEVHVYTPPRHFGKIDLREFDPETYRGQRTVSLR